MSSECERLGCEREVWYTPFSGPHGHLAAVFLVFNCDRANDSALCDCEVKSVDYPYFDNSGERPRLCKRFIWRFVHSLSLTIGGEVYSLNFYVKTRPPIISGLFTAFCVLKTFPGNVLL